MTRKRYAPVKMRLARHATVEGVYTFGPDLPGVRVLPRFYVLKDADPDARAWNLIDRGFEHPGSGALGLGRGRRHEMRMTMFD